MPPEAATVKNNGKTLAEEIAEEMVQAGFTNVAIHPVSSPVAKAIVHLENEKARLDSASFFQSNRKHSRYITANLAALSNNYLASADEVEKIIQGNRSAEKMKRSSYIKTIGSPLFQNITVAAPAVESAPLAQNDAAASDTETSSASTATSSSATSSTPNWVTSFTNRVREYTSTREQEKPYHGHVLGLATSVGTDKLWKGKAYKLNAADKLLNIVQGQREDLTEEDVKALNDGRLGDLVREFGGLETILSHTQGQTVSFA